MLIERGTTQKRCPFSFDAIFYILNDGFKIYVYLSKFRIGGFNGSKPNAKAVLMESCCDYKL